MKKTSGFIIFFIVLGVMWGNAFAGQDVKVDDNPNVSNRSKEKHIEPLLFPIKFYRDCISSADGNRCPMHPTCSQYCIEAFEKHGHIMGWIMCSDRLLRCGRDETKLSGPIWIDNVKRSYDPVSNNDFWRQ